jgi:small subunit ribosomal protein S6
MTRGRYSSVRSYECTIIVAPTVGEDVMKSTTKRYADIITTHEGTLTKMDDWGKRSLAYEIDFHREGHYILYKFRAGNKALKELNRQLRLDEHVIRHLIVKDDLATGEEPDLEKNQPEKGENRVEGGE